MLAAIPGSSLDRSFTLEVATGRSGPISGGSRRSSPDRRQAEALRPLTATESARSIAQDDPSP